MSEAEAPAPPWWRRRPDLALLVALPLHFLLLWLLVLAPGAVEVVYGRGIYPVVCRLQSLLDVTPLSPAAVALVVLLALAARWTWQAHGAPREGERALRRSARLGGGYLWRVLIIAAALGHSFPILWGLNYWRPALPDQLELDLTDTAGFQESATAIVLHANAARVPWPEEPDIGAYDAPIAAAVDALLRELGLGHASLRRRIRFVPRRLMTVTGFHGMVVPYTTEGWVDPSTDVRWLPFAIAHEKAHQAGVAREADANLVAFLALARHPDPYLRYSASFFLIDEFDHLSRVKPTDDVQRDRGIAIEVAKATRVPVVAESTHKVYDTYLKANKVEAGVADYGRVQLLIHAWLRKHPGWLDQRP